MISLSIAQAQIVNAPVGPILVTATAGSGKTRVLTERIRHLLDANPMHGILALTFTNKAAEEMQSRLGSIPKLDQRAFIGTLHSFAQDILQKHGRHIGYRTVPHIFERDEDRIRILNEIIDLPHAQVSEHSLPYMGESIDQNRREVLYGWLNEISKAKRNLWDNDEITLNSSDGELAVYIHEQYKDALKLQNAIDFDDLLLLAYRIVTEKPSIAQIIAQSYTHICIDEAQDLNRAQYEFIKALCCDRISSVLMVGDANQSIYGFNDSSSEFMTQEFVRDFRPAHFELVENFRSSQWVLDLANSIKPGSMKNIKAATLGRGEFCCAVSDTEEARWICDEISKLLAVGAHPELENPITCKSIVVLGRNRYVFQELHNELERRGIEHYLKKSPGALDFESETITVFDLLLRVILNGSDRLHYRQLLSRIGCHQIIRVDEFFSKVLDNTLLCEPVWAPVLTTSIQGIKAAIASSNPSIQILTGRLQELLEDTEHNSAILDEERALAMHDLDELSAHWNRYVNMQATGAKLSVEAFRNAMAMGKTQPDAQEKGIALSTVHTMKGLEYDIVFLMGLGQGTFPDYRAIQKGGKALLEEDNNAFVAVTRAKRFLFVSYPKIKHMSWGGVKAQEASIYWNMLTHH